MTTTTTRVFVEDAERARLIGAVRQLSQQEIIHAALNEYIENHRDELEGAFVAVQRAVLQGDRGALREALLNGVPAQVEEDVRRLDDVWGRD